MRITGYLLKISAIFIIIVSLSGCDVLQKQSVLDFFRSVAGRPSSEEIASKKDSIEIILETKAELARAARMADSLAVLASRENFLLDSLKEAGVLNSMSADIEWSSDTDTDTLARKYYIMVGVFSVKANADNQAKRASESGYETSFVKLDNGRIAVVLNGTDRLAEILPVYDSVRLKSFCPKEAWILSKN